MVTFDMLRHKKSYGISVIHAGIRDRLRSCKSNGVYLWGMDVLKFLCLVIDINV